jgi:hypothetical protein
MGRYNRTEGWALIALTFILTAAGFMLFLAGMAGWAQFLWVVASGTAGAGIVMILEKR